MLDFYSAIPLALGMGLLIGLSSLSWFSGADTPALASAGSARHRFAIDGLRGLLAPCVFFHHAAIYHLYLSEQRWAAPPSHLYAMLGRGGVSVFFIITGYLFWSKLLRENGRPNWVQLYVGRLFRIGPVYLFAIGCMLLLVFLETGLHRVVSWRTLIGEVASWLMLGAGDQPDVNGRPNTYALLAGVTWTLRYEWVFYVSLLPLSLFAVSRRVSLVAVPAALAIIVGCLAFPAGPWHASSSLFYAGLFAMGMTCATLEQNGLMHRLPEPLASLVMTGVTVAWWLSTSGSQSTLWLSLLMLGGIFYLANAGCSLFGLLTSRPLRRLGEMSYDIYLLHGLLLAIAFRFSGVQSFALASPAQHWLVILAVTLALLPVAMLAHILVERPGIAFGRAVGKQLGAYQVVLRAGRPIGAK